MPCPNEFFIFTPALGPIIETSLGQESRFVPVGSLYRIVKHMVKKEALESILGSELSYSVRSNHKIVASYERNMGRHHNRIPPAGLAAVLT